MIKQKLKILLVALAIGNAGAFAFHLYTYGVQIAELRYSLKRSLDDIAQIMANRVEKSVFMLGKLAPSIAKSNGDNTKIRDLINNQVTKAGGDLRIAWTDKEDLLRVGTVIGIFKNDNSVYANDTPINLSHRDYIQRAHARPHETIVSALLAHAVTGRSFFGVAMGITDEKGDYLGCLTSIIDVEYLRELIAQSLRESGFAATIHMPDKTLLYSVGSEEKAYQHLRYTTPQGFALSSAIPAEKHRLLVYASMRSLVVTLLLLNAALIFVYIIYSRLFIAPLERITSHFSDIPDEALDLVPMTMNEHERIAQKALAVRQLLGEHLATKEQTAIYIKRLQEAVELIRALSHEQVSFLSSAGVEMEQAFHALSKYTDFVEGRIAEDYAHADEVFLEDVKDVTLNLKYLANATYQIALHKTGQLALAPEQVDVHERVRKALAILDEMFEWRCISVHINAPDTLPIIHYDSLAKHMIWGVVYLAYKVMDDGTCLTISMEQNEKGCALRLYANRLLQSTLPQAERDIAEFLPSRKQHWGQAVQQQLEYHINMVMVRYFTGHFGGHCSIDVAESAGNLALTLCLQLEEIC